MLGQGGDHRATQFGLFAPLVAMAVTQGCGSRTGLDLDASKAGSADAARDAGADLAAISDDAMPDEANGDVATADASLRDSAGETGLTDTAGASSADSPEAADGAAAPVVLGVAAGEDHTCALLSDGTVRCWGYNGADQRLGSGTTNSSATPVSVSNLRGATAIAAGGAHTCARLSDSTVQCWGSNSHGELGDGTTTTPSRPVSVSNLSGAIAIAAGGAHTCAVFSGGSVACWGANDHGKLGDGTTIDSKTPILLSNLSGVIAIAAGYL